MFVHAQSFEDLTAEARGDAEFDKSEGESAEELKGLVEVDTIEEQRDNNTSSESKSKEEDVSSEAWRNHRKHVFVLSDAGKPIYTRYGTEEALSSTMGVMMALVSFVEAEKNIIRSIQADGCKVVFLTKSPLVLVGVSRTCQSDKELLRELQYIYYQIVSLLTLTQLNHIFKHKQNYDLRRLLAGSEYLTDNLLHRLDRDPGLLLSAVTCLPLASSARDVVSSSLQAAKSKSLVFSILLAGDRLVTLVRKKDQFLHHIDLHLVFNLVGSSSAFREGEGWTPICLPKFNTAGFFHAHISYLEPASELCLILVSTDREDFFNMSDCKKRFLERLSKRSAYQALKEALKCPSYPVAQVGIPELRHFLYKSKSSGLYTSPEFPEVYQSDEEQERLMGLYQDLHSCLHHPTRPLRSFYCCREKENLLAWSAGDQGLSGLRCQQTAQVDQEGGGWPLHPESSHILSPRWRLTTRNEERRPGRRLARRYQQAVDEAVVVQCQHTVLIVRAMHFCLLGSSDLIQRKHSQKCVHESDVYC
ncbi:hypothetical protein F2P81_013068 [Scophthalmus maximus]|uniref:Vacuolar fusion protein MON1 homolog n=1 Tax=Scophthalmus maximus TaxID=52904 RepID=A0A6A4STU4_SCOMX|nr:hypothetical protein F2P81_013068 [Scophthalmus maximus]